MNSVECWLLKWVETCSRIRFPSGSGLGEFGLEVGTRWNNKTPLQLLKLQVVPSAATVLEWSGIGMEWREGR